MQTTTLFSSLILSAKSYSITAIDSCLLSTADQSPKSKDEAATNLLFVHFLLPLRTAQQTPQTPRLSVFQDCIYFFGSHANRLPPAPRNAPQREQTLTLYMNIYTPADDAEMCKCGDDLSINLRIQSTVCVLIDAFVFRLRGSPPTLLRHTVEITETERVALAAG